MFGSSLVRPVSGVIFGVGGLAGCCKWLDFSGVAGTILGLDTYMMNWNILLQQGCGARVVYLGKGLSRVIGLSYEVDVESH